MKATAIAIRFAGALLLAAAPALAGSFPPVSEAEKALNTVAGYPNATAVVLSRKGDFHMLDPARGEQSSILKVSVRIKILQEKGKEEHGEVRILHSPFYRLKELEGRTVLPDGREVALAADSIFVRRASSSRRLMVTSAAFPALEVGAILDYSYIVRFDSIYYLEPWDFQESIPVLHSEITYHVPKALAARAWVHDPLQVGLQSEKSPSALGTDLKLWADNLAPWFDEPLGLPTNDLAARFMLVPTRYAGDALLDTWASTCDLIETSNYNDYRRDDAASSRRGRELAAAGKTPREKALLIYRFVRDEIATEPSPGILVGDKTSPDKTLTARRGDYADKALLLLTLLDGAGLKPRLVWAASREDGEIDPTIPSFSWFDRPLVRVTLDDQEVFLDPSGANLGFGQLEADYEGTSAVLFDRRKPEVITLPTTPAERNGREARLNLEVGADGRVTGTGTLVLSGHHASLGLEVKDAAQGLEKKWGDWLKERLPGFVASELAVKQEVDERRLELSFKLAQAIEEVQGDEVSLNPNRPLGPSHQRLTLPPERRRTPVLFDFGEQENLELKVSWPEGWHVELNPPDRRLDNSVGRFLTTWEVDEAGRSLTYRRHLELRTPKLATREEYTGGRALFELAEKNDAQMLVLAPR